MLSVIASALGGDIVNSLLGRVTGVFESYFKKEITVEELRTKLLVALTDSFKEIEVAHADALAKTFASFMEAMVKSRLMQIVWATVTLSQLGVLLWHQVGIPAVIALGYVKSYPSSGSTVEWAYALIGACIGLGPLVLRTGPGGSKGIVNSLKSLAGK